jgi:hypothetical protein
LKIDKAITHRHPQWCDRDHVEGLHSGVVGDVSLAGGVIEVAVTQYLDRPPVVTIYRYEPADTGLEDLTPELADRLSRLLIAAVAQLDGVR